MSEFAFLVAIFRGTTPLKMIVKTMGPHLIHNISPWHTYPSCTWEALRRIASYQKLYNKYKKQGLKLQNSMKDFELICAKQSFPKLEKYGLLFPANPDHSAVEAHVFWHPNRFQNAVKFYVIPESEVEAEGTVIKLSDFPAYRTHYKGADGSHHIRLLGEKFWFQIHCDNLDLEDENIHIGFNFDRVNDLKKRLETVTQMAGIYDGTIEKKAPLHTPKRPDLHRNSALVYDVRTSGGTWKDAIIAHFGEEYLKENPDNFEAGRTTVRNYFKRAESFIHGDFLKILDQT